MLLKVFALLLLCISPLYVYAELPTFEELPYPTELGSSDCFPSFLASDETIIWACELGGFFRTANSVTEPVLLSPFSGSSRERPDPTAISWITPTDYVARRHYFSAVTQQTTSTIERCSPNCVDITPSQDWMCSSSDEIIIRTNRRGDILIVCVVGTPPTSDYSTIWDTIAAYLIPHSGGPVQVFQHSVEQKEYSAGVLQGLLNSAGQFVYWYRVKKTFGRYWDGTKLRALPKGIKENFIPEVLFEDGSIFGATKNIAWGLVFGRVKEGRFTKVKLLDSDLKNYTKKGSYISGQVSIAEKSAVIRLRTRYSRQKLTLRVDDRGLSRISIPSAIWKANCFVQSGFGDARLLTSCGATLCVEQDRTKPAELQTRRLYILRGSQCQS